MNREKVKMLMERALELLSPLKEEFEVKINPGNGTYDENEFNFKVSFRDAGAQNERVADYEWAQKVYNLKPLGSLIEVPNGRRSKMQLRIVGWAKRNRKYPVIAENDVGTRYKLPMSKAEV